MPEKKSMAQRYLDLLRQQSPTPSTPTGYKELKNFVKEVSEYVAEPARCELILGGVVNYGQEYRVVLSCPPLNYSQTLFRVYISLHDGKITFHPAGGDVEHDVAKFQDRLEAFLKQPIMLETLEYLKAKAASFRRKERES